tara:strand:+ start:382 stop:690 length:309 start_codon:yes stop_codon:yes gene_type:complete
MRILENEAQYFEALAEDQPMPASVMSTSGYGNLDFECGCGNRHRVNGHDVKQIASFRPVKILFKCSTHYTKVRIKGIFSQTCVSEWACKNSLSDNIAKDKGL